ncbi:fibronectin type III domain-containing protein [Cohnella hashimotonis]|uniref:Fibronectin type III domain-containing protein n=1 Tax=Cohnella hashimotonis TaxID=2826895 RepID=A0ABT6TN88_9BACL|nr:fibronectin type III domain-containing protein [Cohnella hashimotonis]MDI4648318.1 fibronectin type III domain-containing protein [Cohnella hashimotonis]
MNGKKRSRPLLAGLALALLLQLAAGFGTAEKAAASTGRAWQAVGGALPVDGPRSYKLAASERGLYMSYLTSGNGLSVYQLAGGSWELDSEDTYAIENVWDYDLFVTARGRPYIAYEDRVDGNKIAVASPDGSGSWQKLGGTIPQGASDEPPGIAVDSQRGISIVYRDKNNGDAATVRKMEDGVWSEPEVISGNNGFRPAIAIDESDRTFVVYGNGASGYYEPVVKSREANEPWSSTGLSTYISGNSYTLKPALHGELFLYYNGGNGTNNQNYVWKWTQAEGWSLIGQFAGFDGAMNVDPTDGRPVVAYRETRDPGGSVHVVKWDGSAWPALGALSLQDNSWYMPLSLAVGPDGTPYVAYVSADDELRVAGYMDTTPPSLIGTLPADGSEDFAEDGTLELTFDEAVRGVAGKKIVVCDEKAVCEQIDASDVRVQANGETVKIAPDGKWREGATLIATIEAGAFADRSGNAYAGLSGGWRFTVAARPPLLTERAPAGVGSASNRPLYMLKFDEKTVPDDGYMTVYRASDDAEIDRIHVTSSSTVLLDEWLVVSGNAELPLDGASYYVLIDGDAFKDEAGIAFAGIADKTAWTFSPFNENAPRVYTMTPVANSTGARGVAALQLTFDKAVRSVEGKSIRVYVKNGSGPDTLFAEVDASKTAIDGVKATINLPGRLPAQSTVYVLVDPGAFEDQEGNPFAGYENDQGWRFDTAAAVAPEAPSLSVVHVGDQQAEIEFLSGDDGGSTVTGYVVMVILPDQNDRILKTVEGEGSPIVVTGLSNGYAYTFKVQAKNAVGLSDYSLPSARAVASGKPVPPLVSANPLDGGASVDVLPSWENGAAVTRYQITVYDEDGGYIRDLYLDPDGEGNLLPAIIDGLTNGTAYKFSARALNANGWSAESDLTDPVVPLGKPGIPRSVVAVPGKGSATVTFEAPEADGGTPVVAYRIRAMKDGAEVSARTIAPDKRSGTIGGLEKGVSYTVEVAAGNNIGLSDFAAAAPVVPYGSPDAPTEVTAAAGDTSAEISFVPGQLYGGTQASYEVTAWDGIEQAGRATGDSSTVTVSNLTNGRTYTFTVMSKTEYGESSPSAPSNAVTPTAPIVPDTSTVPDAPTGVSASAGDASATVSFSAPSNDGGKPIAGYKVTAWSNGAEAKTVESPGTAADGRIAVAVTGLANGTAYTFTVKAVNVKGASQPSAASNTVTPLSASNGGDDGGPGPDSGSGPSPSPSPSPSPGPGQTSGNLPDKGIAYIGGYPDGLFRPNAGLTRAEMAVILTKLFGNVVDAGAEAHFQDVPETHWASQAIAQAAKHGWMSGYPDGKFRPDAALTRAEMVVLLHKLGMKSAQQAGTGFTDIQGHWAESAIVQAQASGIIGGYADGKFLPDRPLTRAEAVTILNKVLGRQDDRSPAPLYFDVTAAHWAYGAIQAASRTE